MVAVPMPLFLKAAKPMLVTVLGRAMPVREEVFSKALD
jgi:hypothetical protein